MRTFYAFRRCAHPALCLLTAVCLLTTMVFLSACAGDVIRLRAKFNIVYCTSSSGGSAAVPSVQGEGGAGYILSYGGKDYTAAACYFLSGEANAYADSLTKRGLESKVLYLSLYKFRLETYNASQCAALYEENLNILYELSRRLGDVVYLIDSGSLNNAREILRECVQQFTALLNKNRSNCFTLPLARLITLASDCAYSGVVLAREVRYLQLATVSAVINTKLT